MQQLFSDDSYEMSTVFSVQCYIFLYAVRMWYIITDSDDLFL